MGKLIDLTGARITINSMTKADADYGHFNIIGTLTTPYGDTYYLSGSDKNFFIGYFEDTSSPYQNRIMYNYLLQSGYVGTNEIFLADGYSHDGDFVIEISGGDDLTDPDLIEWCINNTIVDGGTWEVEEVLDLDSYLKNIADAIRTKKGTTKSINAQDFVDEILSI